MGLLWRSGLLGLLWLVGALAIPAAQIGAGLAGPGLAEEGLAREGLAEPLTSMVEVRQSGGFDSSTLSLIDDAVRAVRGESTALHRVTLRMLRVTRAGEIVQQAADGFGYPMLTMAVDPAAPAVPVDLRATLTLGQAAMGEVTAGLRGAKVGDLIDLETLEGRVVSVRIGAIVPDEMLRWSEILIGHSMVPGLDIDRPYAVVAWGTNGVPLAAAIRIWTTDPGVRVLDGLEDPVSDPVLPVAVVKDRFGEFAVAPAAGDAVQVDRDWRDTWIVTADFPIVGETRCHRMVVPYIGAALDEVERSGLASELDRADFQLAGGCYNPRFNRGADPGYSLSRHSWGISVDFNPSTNRYGEVPAMSVEIVEIFRRWGFSWGGTWTVPDGMHFEWSRLPTVYAARCSGVTAVQDSLLTGSDQEPPVVPSWVLLPAGGPCQ